MGYNFSTRAYCNCLVCFFLRSNIPVRDDRIYVFYRNTLLRRERDISDWHYQSRVIEDLQRKMSY